MSRNIAATPRPVYAAAPDPILRIKDAMALTALSRSGTYALIASGDHPEQIYLSARSVGFLQSEITAFIEKRVVESRARQLEVKSKRLAAMRKLVGDDGRTPGLLGDLPPGGKVPAQARAAVASTVRS